ncbi:hypothetical protein DPMN_124114 [Dreissena polymorpha]|uniref:B box-type domain-containing protein n=1 Tax=Dreissena polymorpha TaxID=45954 RepID=A0A9D4JVY4_DREPO|nr:hypothetical protein DPMN_124114 [Dreissena polymorpha]
MATYSQSYFNKGSDCVKDFCCETCDEKTIEEGADFFCETCLKLYCGKCIDLHGQLFTKHATYGRDDMRKWPANKEVENFLQRCEIHTDENLILFCKNHSQLSCALCDVHSHRKCPDVELITEAHKITRQTCNNCQLKSNLF